MGQGPLPLDEMKSCEMLSRGHSVTQVQVSLILYCQLRKGGRVETEVERLLQTPGGEDQSQETAGVATFWVFQSCSEKVC